MTPHKQQWAEYYQQLSPPPPRHPPSETITRPSGLRELSPPPPPHIRRCYEATPYDGEPSPHLEEPTDSGSELEDEEDDSESNTDHVHLLQTSDLSIQESQKLWGPHPENGGYAETPNLLTAT